VGDALVGIGGAFLAAGLLARVGRQIGLPTIPFFMVAGILFGPHTPGVVIIDEPERVELLSALGLILLLFYLGLEFSLGDLVEGGRQLLVAGATYLALNVGGGLAFGFALGWGTAEAFVIAGAVGISSSVIVTKLLIELRRLADPESRTILGIAVVQDIFVALYIALLQPALGDATSAADAVAEFLVAFAFLATLAATARWGAGLAGRLVAAPDDELLTVLFVGLAVLVAGIAAELGVSEAIGAFGVGLVLAETSVADRVERLVLPLRDAFAAAFFFAFGLSIDPGDAGTVIGPVMAAVGLTLLLNLVSGVMIARQEGSGRRPAANIAFTLLGRGELSLILAALAATAGLDGRLGPFIALYVLILAIVGPLLTAQSRRLAQWLPARLEPAADAA
jgi:CPA2 family monovalent cation:H+ antiporter-2